MEKHINRKLFILLAILPVLYCSHKADKSQYRVYADTHYWAAVYRDWWNGLDTSYQEMYSHRIEFGPIGNPIRSDEYYENIGKYDQFQVGWDDIGLAHIPPGVPGGDSAGTMSPDRRQYLDLWNKAH